MDFSPPTTADYAWSDARDAQDRAQKLEERLAVLERLVAMLLQKLDSAGVIGPLDRKNQSD